MPSEKIVHNILKKAGYSPVDDRSIIVTYAPVNLSEKISRFFSNEFFVLQMCESSLVLLPFGRMSFMLKKNVALEIPYTRIHKVEVKELLYIAPKSGNILFRMWKFKYSIYTVWNFANI